MEKGLYHILFASFKPEASEELREAIYNAYQGLGEECGGRDAGILFYSAKKNLDLRKNIHVVQFIIFENDEALQKYRFHPKHVEFVQNLLSKGADWTVGDFLLP